MSNYLSGVVDSNFGDKKVKFATCINDEGAVGAVVTGFNNIDFVSFSPNTAGDYVPHYSVSGGSITLTTATSGSSYKVMIVGR